VSGSTLPVASERRSLRAFKRGDLARARSLAEEVIAAWSVTYRPLPAVAKMKEMLARAR